VDTRTVAEESRRTQLCVWLESDASDLFAAWNDSWLLDEPQASLGPMWVHLGPPLPGGGIRESDAEAGCPHAASYRVVEVKGFMTGLGRARRAGRPAACLGSSAGVRKSGCLNVTRR